MKRRDTVVRYTAPERINHWVTAFCFVLAAVSGLGFFFPSFNWLMQIMGTPQLARILHPFVGVIMFASFIIMFFRYWHHNLINRDDIFWAKNIRKIVVNEEVGDTGRYNFGQKCVFYKFNQLDDNDYTRAAKVATDDQAAVGIVYQF